MLSVADNADLKLAVFLALTTGASRIEVCSLEHEDIDLQNGLITFSQTKNRASRPLRYMVNRRNYY